MSVISVSLVSIDFLLWNCKLVYYVTVNIFSGLKL